MRLTRLKIFTLCLVVILVTPFAGTAAEEEPDGTWKPPPIGTKVAYNYGAKYEIIRTEGSKVYAKGSRSAETKDMTLRWYIYKGMFHSTWYDGKRASFDEAAVDELFPLKVGNKTMVDAEKTDGWSWKTAYKVTKYKEVETLLGNRAVFVIAFLERGRGHKAKGWGYYDPELGIWHRGSYTWGNNDPYKWKLTHLEIPE